MTAPADRPRASAEGSIEEDNGSASEYPYFFRTIAENKQYK